MAFKPTNIYNTKIVNLADLTFEDVATTGRGYDENDPQKKSVDNWVYAYPVVLIAGYKNLLRHNHCNLKSMAAIQRYSTILGHAIIELKDDYVRLKETFEQLSDIDEPQLQVRLETKVQYLYKTPLMSGKRKIKTVSYVQDWVSENAHVFQMHESELLVILSMFGMEKSLNGLRDKTRDGIEVEVDEFNQSLNRLNKFYVATKNQYGLV